MRVIVTGGRQFKDYGLVCKTLEPLGVTVLVEGGCSGADRLARRWADRRNIPYETFHAKWDEYGKFAGPQRNSDMVRAGADLVVAFPGGQGTADCVRTARRANIRVLEVTSDE